MRSARLRGAVVVLLAAALVMVLVGCGSPTIVERDSMSPPMLENHASGANSAIVRADVESVGPGSSPAVQEITLRVDTVEWEAIADPVVASSRRVAPGVDRWHGATPDVEPGDVLEAYAWADHEYVAGRTYVVILGYLALAETVDDYPLPPWRVSLGFDGGRAVDGVEDEVRQDIMTILAPGETLAEDGVQAVVEFTIEQVRALDARNAGRPVEDIGPRTQRLEAARAQREQQRDRVRDDIVLSRWLDTPPERRFLGVAEADIPAGARQELGVSWVEALALVLYDPTDPPLLDRVVVVTPHGQGLVSPLPLDRTAMLLPFVKARGSWLAVASWPRSADGYELLSERSEATGTAVDEWPRLVIDLRGHAVEMRTVDAAEFDDLVIEHRP